MTPSRLLEIKAMLAKTFPCPSDMIQAREAAKELVEEVERLDSAYRLLAAGSREVCRCEREPLSAHVTDGAPERVWCEPETDGAGWECEVGGWTHSKQFPHAVEYLSRAYHDRLMREAADRACGMVKVEQNNIESNELISVSFDDEWLCTRGASMATASFIQRFKAALRSAILSAPEI